MAGSTTATEPVANRRIGIPLVLMAGIFWSLSGLVYRWIEVATAWQVLFYRSLSLFCFIALWLVLRYRGRLVGVFQSAGRLSVLGGLCLSIAFSGYILALDQTTVANALFILAAAPFFAALLGRVLLSEHIRWTTSLAMGMAALGLAVMAGKEPRPRRTFCASVRLGIGRTDHYAANATKYRHAAGDFIRQSFCNALCVNRNAVGR